MSEVKGTYFGEDDHYQRIGAVTVADFASQFELDFENLDATIDGKPVSVVGLVCVLPKASFTQTADSISDGLTLAQMMSEVSIEYAANSGPHRALGHRQYCNKLDGPRLLQLLTKESGRAPFPGLGSNAGVVGTVLNTVIGTAAGHLVQTEFGQQVLGNWLQYLGAFCAAKTAETAAFAERPVVGFWFGDRVGHEDAAWPAEWLKGARGCKGSEPGRIVIKLASAIDGMTVTWGGTAAENTFEVYAIVRKCGAKQPVGHVAEIKVLRFATEGCTLPSGFLSFVGFAKPLVAGAMQTHSYTDVDLTNDGAAMIDSRMSEQNRIMNAMHARGMGGFGFAVNDGAIASKARVARRLNWCQPLVCAPPGASILRMRGTDREGCIKVRVNSSSESTHELLVHRYLPFSDESRAATIKAAQTGCGGETAPVEMKPNARNGNDVASRSLADALPQTIVRQALLTSNNAPK